MVTDYYVTPLGALVYDLTSRGEVVGVRTTTLDSVMGFDSHPIRVYVDPDDRATHVVELPDDWAPESIPDATKQVGEWSALTGFTGQYGYNGSTMHPSEHIGGALERHILSTPGDYAVVMVTDTADTSDDDPDGDYDVDIVGWAVLYRETPGR